MGWFIRTFWTLATGGAVYISVILALTIPSIQRKATYVYNVNPTVYQNLSNVDQFGFLRHQVQPFTVTTEDGCILYAWHILPAHLYRDHERELKNQPNFNVRRSFEEVKKDSVGLGLLFDDPRARVVVSFHGNAGHLASSYRAPTYQSFLGCSTPERPVHVVAFDYRGFGLSSGSPTEDGVVLDGVSVLDELTGRRKKRKIEQVPALRVNGVDDGAGTGAAKNGGDGDGSVGDKYLQSSQIILVGQSMGTFISTAVFHDWTLRLKQPSPKGLMLFASFSSLEQLLESYSLKGLTPPVLSPLAGYPPIQRWFLSKIVDKWDTASRIKALVKEPGVGLDLTIMHARDDWEIPWREGKRNWEAVIEAAEGEGDLKVEDDASDPSLSIGTWSTGDGLKRVRWEKVRHGSHNKIPTSEHAKIALLEILDR